ncbi:MAG: hypothetical protein Q4P33_04790 [Flaviflexus sp.]|nr:hypothetical protein [Flaviflexus sp.]
MKSRPILALIAVCAIAGCSHPSEAAEVNGQPIDIDTVGEVNDELRAAGLNVTPEATLGLLISARATAPVRTEIPVASDPKLISLAETQLGLADTDYSPATGKVVDFFAFIIASQNGIAMPDEVTEVSDAIKNADVDVNPRFGTWEGESGQLLPAQSDYLITPQASPLP